MAYSIIKPGIIISLAVSTLKIFCITETATATELQCEIVFTKASGFVEILATVSQQPSENSHNYVLNVKSSSNGNNSTSIQSGKVNFTTYSEKTVLSRSIIGANPNAKIDAVLKITDQQGAEICVVKKIFGSNKPKEKIEEDGKLKI